MYCYLFSLLCCHRPGRDDGRDNEATTTNNEPGEAISFKINIQHFFKNILDSRLLKFTRLYLEADGEVVTVIRRVMTLKKKEI